MRKEQLGMVRGSRVYGKTPNMYQAREGRDGRGVGGKTREREREDQGGGRVAKNKKV